MEGPLAGRWTGSAFCLQNAGICHCSCRVLRAELYVRATPRPPGPFESVCMRRPGGILVRVFGFERPWIETSTCLNRPRRLQLD